MPSRIERTLQKSMAHLTRGQPAAERRRDRIVVDAVGEPVTAEEQPIAVFEAQEINVDLDLPGRPPSALISTWRKPERVTSPGGSCASARKPAA